MSPKPEAGALELEAPTGTGRCQSSPAGTQTQDTVRYMMDLLSLLYSPNNKKTEIKFIDPTSSSIFIFKEGGMRSRLKKRPGCCFCHAGGRGRGVWHHVWQVLDSSRFFPASLLIEGMLASRLSHGDAQRADRLWLMMRSSFNI